MAFLVDRSPSKVKNKFWTAGKKTESQLETQCFDAQFLKGTLTSCCCVCVTFSPSKMVLYIFPPTW